MLDLPFRLAAWEPAYCLATYDDDGGEFPAPDLPVRLTAVDLPADPPEQLDDDAVDLALRQLVEPWTTTSNGRAEVVAVDGDAAGALRALGLARARWAPLDAGAAVAWLAWAGASGGAHGRRRGAAAGRFGALWLVAALLDALDDWPLPLDELGALAADAALVVVGRPRAGDRLAAAARRRGPGRAPGLGDQRPRRRLTPTHPSVSCIGVFRAGGPGAKHSHARNTRMGGPLVPLRRAADHLASAPMSRARALVVSVGIALATVGAGATGVGDDTAVAPADGAGRVATTVPGGTGAPPTTAAVAAAGRHARRRRRRQRRQARRSETWSPRRIATMTALAVVALAAIGYAYGKLRSAPPRHPDLARRAPGPRRRRPPRGDRS